MGKENLEKIIRSYESVIGEYSDIVNNTTIPEIISVILPQNLKKIGFDAFSNCISLTAITFSGGLAVIGESAFEGCEKLKSLVFPDTLSVIEASAFEGCENLNSIKFGDGLSVIGEVAFGIPR